MNASFYSWFSLTKHWSLVHLSLSFVPKKFSTVSSSFRAQGGMAAHVQGAEKEGGCPSLKWLPDFGWPFLGHRWSLSLLHSCSLPPRGPVSSPAQTGCAKMPKGVWRWWDPGLPAQDSWLPRSVPTQGRVDAGHPDGRQQPQAAGPRRGPHGIQVWLPE